MLRSTLLARLRDVTAICVTGIFLFPLFWWALTAFKPGDAVLNKDRIVFFDFVPTLGNFYLSLGDEAPEAFRAHEAARDTLIVAGLSSAISVIAGLMAAYALSRLEWRGKQVLLAVVLAFRFMPPVALLIPVFMMFHQTGLFDTRFGLACMHGLLNLPLAVLVLKSFIDDVPLSIDEAAKLDGASSFQVMWRIIFPAIQGGVAATVILCMIFSSTEYLMSSALSLSFKTLPIKLSNLVMASYGPLAALGTVLLLPSFVFVLLTQRYLVRGLSLGALK